MCREASYVDRVTLVAENGVRVFSVHYMVYWGSYILFTTKTRMLMMQILHQIESRYYESML